MFARRSYEEELETWNGWLRKINGRIKNVPGVSTKLLPPTVG